MQWVCIYLVIFNVCLPWNHLGIEKNDDFSLLSIDVLINRSPFCFCVDIRWIARSRTQKSELTPNEHRMSRRRSLLWSFTQVTRGVKLMVTWRHSTNQRQHWCKTFLSMLVAVSLETNVIFDFINEESRFYRLKMDHSPYQKDVWLLKRAFRWSIMACCS